MVLAHSLQSTESVGIIPPDENQEPTLEDFNIARYNTKISRLCGYFVDIAYLLQEKIPFGEDQMALSMLETYISFLTKGTATIKRILTYCCPPIAGLFETETSYGGMIIDYKIGAKTFTFIIFRGTKTAYEGLEDAKVNLEPVSWCDDPNFKIHVGFNNMYTHSSRSRPSLRHQIWDYINNNNVENLIILSGHSLGGALSNLLISDISLRVSNARINKIRTNTKVYTFAAPYSGNQTFVNTILNSYNAGNYSGIFSIINNLDPVCVAGISGYSRIPMQTFCFISPGTPELGVTAVHSMSTYISAVEDNAALFDSNFNKRSCGMQCVSFIE